jgi:serine/threonine protein kinase
MAPADQGNSGVKMVGRYELLRELGRGGMAIVYMARQPDLDRHVALKELSRFHQGSPEFAHRFLRESRLAGSLNHPNIVTVHEYFEHDGIPYIAMEFVPRGSLRPYTKRLSLAQMSGVLEGVLAGLAHAAQSSIVHRDLKPENIMVTADGRVKITDFGIARATQAAGTQFMTATGMTVGTPTYMAPEQAMAGDIGPWTDLYSVGVMAYELVVGHVPFHDTDAPMVILMRHVNERIPSAIEVRPDVDPALSDWIDSLLVKEPKDRLQHPSEAWEQLEDITVNLLGPIWRRHARLLEDQIAIQGSQPLTPAPFESQVKLPTPPPSPAATPASFVTFEPEAVSPPAAPSTPTPAPAPPVAPSTPTPTPTPTPAPAPASTPTESIPTPATPPVVPPEPAVPAQSPPPRHETEFVTFGAPAAPPPVTPPPAPVPTPPEPLPAPPAPPEPEPAPPEPEPIPTPPEPVPVPPAPAEPEPAPPEPEPAPREPEPALPGPEPVPTPPEPVPVPTPPEPSPTPPEPVAVPAPEREPVAAAITAEPVASRERPSREPSSGGPPIGVIAAVLVVVAAVIGYLVAPSSTKKTAAAPVALSQHATAGPLAISFPADWAKAASAPAGAATFKLADAVSLSGGKAAPGGTLVIGLAKTTSATLLPASFVSALSSAPQSTTVKLGSQIYKRYLDLIPQGGGPESVYVLPTAAGTATAICIAPQSGATEFAVACEQAIATLTSRSSVLPLGANPGYAKGLSVIVAKLNSARRTLGGTLASAKSQSKQGHAADALAGAYDHAATAADKLTPGPASGAAAAALVSALRQLESGYSALGKAASQNNGRNYSAAQSAIAKGQTALAGAFSQLQQDGYKLG